MSELNFTHSNGNKVKLTTPDTLAASETFKLPGADGSSNQAMVTNGSGALLFASLGVTMADQWMLTSSFSPGGAVSIVTSGWGGVSRAGYGSIGSAMTVSSGVFTFPTTGIWLIQMTIVISNNGDSRTNQLLINTTTDGSSFSPACKGNQSIAHAQSSHTYSTGSTFFIFDVTNTSTHKVSFSTNVNDDSASTYGETDVSRTHFSFIRLGDT